MYCRVVFQKSINFYQTTWRHIYVVTVVRTSNLTTTSIGFRAACLRNALHDELARIGNEMGFDTQYTYIQIHEGDSARVDVWKEKK
jgi:hypothetical protein